MIHILRALAGIVLVAFVASCSSPSTAPGPYSGPAVTQILVKKGERQMFLMHGNTVLKKYAVSLGYEPVGGKMFEGDGRTPEGTYFIDRFNPASRYHLSVGISYPSPADVQRAAGYGLPAGRDIFIHGRGTEGNAAIGQKVRDWTAGCISVSDREMEEVYAMLRPGVPIIIQP